MMDFEWVAIALGDVAWISLAFAFGFAARAVSLPPLVGFLATGFLLNYFGADSGDVLQKLADLGITLLLFVVGLKLKLKILVRPQVWLVTVIHVLSVVLFFGVLIVGFGWLKMPLFVDLDFPLALLLAFSLSFSSTVFVVKILEDRGEIKSLHGQIAIGILVVQDLAAVIFLATSTGKLPTPWAVLLVGLIPLRVVFHYFLRKTGHGELLILYGLVLALGGAEVFELAGVKDDLGALVMGMLISTHPKSSEMAKAMLGFKDLFLVGFFLSIGMSGQLSVETLLIGVFLVPFIFVKSALFFVLMSHFNLRARTSLLATLNLTNYSEFSLIVAAIGVGNGWLDASWLLVIAIALSLSFVVSAPINNQANRIYTRFNDFWCRWQLPERLPDDPLLDTCGATIAIFGMGRVGTGAYDKMKEISGETIIGVDSDPELVARQRKATRMIIHGDPRDADFWDKVEQNHNIRMVMLALPNIQANLGALEQLRKIGFPGRIAATAKFPDEVDILKNAGATEVFNIYTEAGSGFAHHVQRNMIEGTPDAQTDLSKPRSS